MALADAVQGGKRPSQSITWYDQDDNVVDLTGATITGRLYNLATAESSDADGSFVLTDAANGIFRWDYGTTDVGTAGQFKVQFTATYSSGVTPARTIRESWTVHTAI